jgi:hypothetical protein
MYIQSNIQARSRKYCCRGEAVSTKHFEFVSVVLLDYQEYKSLLFCAVSYGHLWPVWLCRISLHYPTNCMILTKKKLNITYVLIFSTIFVRNTSHFKKN